MANKTYNRITAALLLFFGVGGVLVSLVHAIPVYGALGMIPLVISVGTIILGLDKDTD